MHIVIMGCGRVGSTLARALVARGHEVSVIDLDVDAFRRLGPEFTGRTIKGVGFDKEVLLKAGITNADGFAAVSNGDNSNILAARVVREQFGVKNVVARIYDPARAEVFEKMGIPTVATVRWTAGQVLAHLLPDVRKPEWLDPSMNVGLQQMNYHDDWVGMPLSQIEADLRVRVASMQRLGSGFVPDARTVLQAGDLVWLAAPLNRLAEVRELLSHAPEKH